MVGVDICRLFKKQLQRFSCENSHTDDFVVTSSLSVTSPIDHNI